MLRDRILNQPEIIAVLARLGFEETYRSGDYVVYDNNQGGVILIHLASQWERTFHDLARQLSDYGITRTEVEVALESLYSDH